MTDVKICGLTTPEAVDATAAEGARYAGFVFYPPSPRHVSTETAHQLSKRLPTGVRAVGLFVNPSDDQIRDIIDAVGLDLVQLHGDETPQRVAAVRKRFAIPVMKAVRIAEATDVEAARAYEPVADMLLFDAKPPPGVAALPGGNGLSFDWTLLAGLRWTRPWLLSGGLAPETVGTAISLTGAPGVDVSSGVESRPGMKSAEKIAAFMAASRHGTHTNTANTA